MTTQLDFEQHEKAQGALTSCHIDQAAHDEIEHLTKEFLAKGKKIKVLNGFERAQKSPSRQFVIGPSNSIHAQ